MAKYRLQIVLDKRQKIKEDAEKNLAEAQQAVIAEQKKEQECVDEVEKAKQRKEDEKKELNKKTMEGLLSIEKIKMGKEFLKTLDFEIKKAQDKLEQQRLKVQEAKDFVEKRRAELVEATKEFQAIEKHKQKWHEQLKKEMEAKEQEEQEEIGNVLFLQRKSKE
jgi:type III secretion system (T3SS) protein YscO